MLSLLLAAGCGGGAPDDTPETGTVTGVVTLDGKPMSGVVVTFAPTSGRPSTGQTNAEGQYTLVYAEGVDGAAVGEHKVSVNTLTENPDPMFKDPIPAKYNSNTELKQQVTAGENVINLELKSK